MEKRERERTEVKEREREKRGKIRESRVGRAAWITCKEGWVDS